MTKLKEGSWKKERTTGRKYSKSDAHKKPKPGSRKQVWVSGYTTKSGIKVRGRYRKNPNYKRKR